MHRLYIEPSPSSVWVNESGWVAMTARATVVWLSVLMMVYETVMVLVLMKEQ